MSIEVELNVNKIAKPTIKKTFVEFKDGLGTDREIASLGLAKGDLIGFRGAGDPVRIQAGGIDGRVLMVDSTKESGWAVSPVSGSSQSVTLHNGLGEIIAGGTIVKISSGYEMAKATSEDTTMLFITSEDCNDDADVVCYGTANTIVSIRCTEDAVAVGDQLGVSSIDGVAETVESNGFARAITAKASGSAGSVNAVIAQAGFLPLTGGAITGNLEVSNNLIVGNDLSAANLKPTNPVDPTYGGTGQTSLQSTRNAMGLGDTTGALPIANGGTGASTVADACANLGLEDSGWKTLNSSIQTYYRKLGPIVNVVVPRRQVNQGTFTLGTLPSDYRPKGEVMSWSDGGKNSYLQVNTSGTVVLRQNGSNPDYVGGNIMYFVA